VQKDRNRETHKNHTFFIVSLYFCLLVFCLLSSPVALTKDNTCKATFNTKLNSQPEFNHIELLKKMGLSLIPTGNLRPLTDMSKNDLLSLITKTASLEKDPAKKEKWIQFMKVLIKQGFDVNQTDKEGVAPLHYAVFLKSKKSIKLFLDAGADPFLNGGILPSPFSLSNEEISEFITENIKNTKKIDEAGNTLVMKAIREKESWFAWRLIEEGANIHLKNKKGENSLLIALKNGETDLAQILIETGADIHSADKNGNTALLLALEKNYTKIVKILLQKGAVIDFQTDLINISSLETLKMLFELPRGATHKNKLKFNQADEYGNTMLHYAIIRNNLEMALFLIEEGMVDTNYQNTEGITALHFAVMKDNIEMTRLLIQKGADIHLKDKRGVSPLDISLSEKKVLQLLKERPQKTLLEDHTNNIIPFVQRRKKDQKAKNSF